MQSIYHLGESSPPLPRFTKLQPFREAVLIYPRKLKEPVSRYKPFTRVHRNVEKGFSSVPLLEQNLATTPLTKATFFGHHCQLLWMKFTLTTLTLQTRVPLRFAAQNNMALLSSAVSAMASKPRALALEWPNDIGKAVTVVPTLTTPAVVFASRIIACEIMVHIHIWDLGPLLHWHRPMSSLGEELSSCRCYVPCMRQLYCVRW